MRKQRNECKEEQLLEIETIQATLDPERETFSYVNEQCKEDGFYIKLSPPDVTDFVVSLLIKFPPLYPKVEGLTEHIDFHFAEGGDRYSEVLTASSFDALSREGILKQLKEICESHKGEMTVWYLLEFIRTTNYEIIDINKEGLFGLLPEDLLLNIFHNFDMYDLVTAGLVNKLWSRLVKDKFLWTSLLKRELQNLNGFDNIQKPKKIEQNYLDFYFSCKKQVATAFANHWPVGVVICQEVNTHATSLNSQRGTSRPWETSFLSKSNIRISKTYPTNTIFKYPKKVYELDTSTHYGSSFYEVLFLNGHEAKCLFSGLQWWTKSQKNMKACPWIIDQPQGVMFWRLKPNSIVSTKLVKLVNSAMGHVVKLEQTCSYPLLVYKDISEDLYRTFMGQIDPGDTDHLWINSDPTSAYFKSLNKTVLEIANKTLEAMKRRKAVTLKRNWEFIGNDANWECFDRMKNVETYWWVLDTKTLMHDSWFQDCFTNCYSKKQEDKQIFPKRLVPGDLSLLYH